MQDGIDILDEDLSGLSPTKWRERLAALAEEVGMFQGLGSKHAAAFIDQGNTLLVSFETIQGIQKLSDLAQPLGFDLVKNLGWSHLCMISDGDTWFRDEQIYAFFDQLIDDGFFDEFDNVVFYGAGPCGYAACAYSVAATGARVLAVQPQATLDPRITEWDDRFTELRRTNFTDRYGYAPDMIDAAEHAYVLYDPKQQFDAMHAALFQRKNVTRLRLPYFGTEIQTRLVEMDILYALIALAGQGQLNEMRFAKMLRKRRDNGVYLRSLMLSVEKQDRPYLLALLCHNVVQRRKAPRFRNRLEALIQRGRDGEFKLPNGINT